MARPRKPEGQTRERLLQVRVLEKEYSSFKEAAEQSGLDLSAWVRERLVQALRKELKLPQKTIKSVPNASTHGTLPAPQSNSEPAWFSAEWHDSVSVFRPYEHIR